MSLRQIHVFERAPRDRLSLACSTCQGNLCSTSASSWPPNATAADLDLPALADSGYESAGHGIKTPVKQPTDGSWLAPDNRLLRGLRWQGERGFAILIGRWKTYVTPPPTPAGSATSSPPHCT